MANKKDIITGSIMEVPLKKGLGFGYIKLIFSKEIQPQYFNHLIIKVYDKFSNNRLSGRFNVKEFENNDLVCYPLLMSTLPRLRGEDKWKLLGYVKLTEEDKIIPDFIHSWKFGGLTQDEIRNACEKSKYGCGIIRNFQNKTLFTRDFESIKHMGIWFHYGCEGIRDIITINLINSRGENFSDYYKKDDLNKDFWLPLLKSSVEKRGIDFKGIKNKNRFKAIIKT